MNQIVIFNIIKGKRVVSVIIRREKKLCHLVRKQPFIQPLFEFELLSRADELRQKRLPVSVSEEIVVQETDALPFFLIKF